MWAFCRTFASCWQHPLATTSTSWCSFGPRWALVVYLVTQSQIFKQSFGSVDLSHLENPRSKMKVTGKPPTQILATDRRHSTADVVLNQPECRRFFVNMLNDPEMRLQTRAMSCFCLSILAKNSHKNQVPIFAHSQFSYFCWRFVNYYRISN